MVNPFKPFSRFIQPYKRHIVWGLLLLVGVQAISSAMPLILQHAVDTARQGGDDGRQALVNGGLVLAVLAVVSWTMNFGMRWYLTSASRRIERDIRQAYSTHLLLLSLDFFQERRIGDLMARATNDLEAIQRFLSHAFRMTLTGLLAFGMSLVLMCSIDWELALYALAPMPVLVVCTRWVGQKVRVGYRRVQEQFGDMSTCIQENLAGIRVIKAYARNDAEIKRFGALNEEFVERNRRMVLIRSLFFPATMLLNGLAMVAVLWLGGLRVIEGTLTLGAFLAFNMYLIRMSRPMMLLGRMVDEYHRAAASMQRIDNILSLEPQDRSGAEAAADIAGEIEFCDVGVEFDGQPALQNINIKIPAGSSLGIVGRVGSGKSTLARLVPRLLEADSGEVLLDGVPLGQVPLGGLRASIGYVPQESFLFSDTIEENIALGSVTGARDGAVAEATELARLASDLETMPEGLDTLVGERGVTLSGGQKQRTALARAAIRQPRVLILDDAMASVDSRTEKEILKGLRQVMQQRTTLVIAHRISTVMEADQIIVLDEGRIVERGDHAQLLELDGIYADMYRRQHLADELGDL
jgi:ATP-binding cassette, subfamily B, multidrug efflux pump